MQLSQTAIFALIASFLLSGKVQAQHLWWKEASDLKEAKCLYGEITVLVSHPAIYYCGANWHPGEPSGGYCGIQHNDQTERRTIFSIWDTAPKLNPHVTQADPITIFNRFGGEGEGAHTHMAWDWKEGETFQYFVRKQPGPTPDVTEAKYYIFDHTTSKWRLSATITSPNGDPKSARSVSTLGGGGIASFLENFLGKDKDLPKIALYRVWLGSDVNQLKCLTRVSGDGVWGKLNDCYFLAEGDAGQLKSAFAKWKEKLGEPVFAKEGQTLDSIHNKPLSDALKRELGDLPAAASVSAR